MSIWHISSQELIIFRSGMNSSPHAEYYRVGPGGQRRRQRNFDVLKARNVALIWVSLEELAVGAACSLLEVYQDVPHNIQ